MKCHFKFARLWTDFHLLVLLLTAQRGEKLVIFVTITETAFIVYIFFGEREQETLSSQRTLEFYVLLSVHLGIKFVNNQLEAQFFFMYVYFYSPRFSGIWLPETRRE
jgi:hypothetical protein